MGQINTYQRSKLASSAVGVVAPSTAGSIIGDSASKFGDALVTRQQALDKIQATNAFYSFAQKDRLNNIQTRQDNLQDPQGYLPKYEESSNVLAEKAKEQIPDRLHGLFDSAVNKYRADNAGKNQAWVFDRENRNAIEGVFNFANGLTDTAITWTSPTNYIEDVQKFKAEFEDMSKVLTPNSAASVEKKALQSAAEMYWASNTDVNTGDPIRLARDLETDTGLKEMLIEGMGAAQFEKKKQGLDKVRASYIDNVAWKDLLTKNEAALEYFSSALDENTPFRLAQAEKSLTMSQNRLIKLRNDNKDGVNDKLITNEEEHIRTLSNLRDFVARGDNAQVVDDALVKGKLEDDIVAAVVGRMTYDEKKEMWADVPGRTRKDGSKANQSYTDYFVGLAKAESSVYKALGRGEIKASTADMLINKIVTPLKSLERFDKLSTASGDYVSLGYNRFNDLAEDLLGKRREVKTVMDVMAASASGPTGFFQQKTVGVNQEAVAKLRSDMFSQYMLKMNEMYNTDLPVDIPADAAQSVMNDIIFDFSRSMYPELSGVAKGGTFKDRQGVMRVFKDIDQRGNIVTEDPSKSTDKAIGNI